jgi:hypothetical protein
MKLRQYAQHSKLPHSEGCFRQREGLALEFLTLRAEVRATVHPVFTLDLSSAALAWQSGHSIGV